MLVNSPTDLIHGDCFLALRSFIPQTTVHLKLEGYSITGSIKIKPALHMINQLQATGRLTARSRLIESSSGNLGVALSMICAERKIPFICVSDPNISTATAQLIRAYGAGLKIVHNTDESGGYLGARLKLIRSMLDQDRELVWINQYENPGNVQAHYLGTGTEILARFAAPDFVFVGAGTTGTLGGVSKALREKSPKTKIIAVDTVGSVTFGGVPGKRYIPGLGTSVVPPISNSANFDELLMVPETETIITCRRLAAIGLLLGGSSGTVMAGISRYAARIHAGACVVMIAPDLGERYAGTIYNDEWVCAHFPTLNDLIGSSKNQRCQLQGVTS